MATVTSVPGLLFTCPTTLGRGQCLLRSDWISGLLFVNPYLPLKTRAIKTGRSLVKQEKECPESFLLAAGIKNPMFHSLLDAQR